MEPMPIMIKNAAWEEIKNKITAEANKLLELK